jgi:hypothetical protein
LPGSGNALFLELYIAYSMHRGLLGVGFDGLVKPLRNGLKLLGWYVEVWVNGVRAGWLVAPRQFLHTHGKIMSSYRQYHFTSNSHYRSWTRMQE